MLGQAARGSRPAGPRGQLVGLRPASFASQGGLSLGVGEGRQAGFRPLGWSGEPSCTFLLSLKSLSCQFLEKVLLKVLSFFLEEE